MPTERFRLCERINGKLVRSFAAEAYSVLPAGTWLDMVPTSIPDETMRNGMVKRLASIHAMRCHAGEAFERLGLATRFVALRTGKMTAIHMEPQSSNLECHAHHRTI